MLGVIACPISSGDTAFRSARLTIADALKLDQKSYRNRLLVTIPLLSLGVLVSQLDYTSIWNYFASTNQILAAIVVGQRIEGDANDKLFFRPLKNRPRSLGANGRLTAIIRHIIGEY